MEHGQQDGWCVPVGAPGCVLFGGELGWLVGREACESCRTRNREVAQVGQCSEGRGERAVEYNVLILISYEYSELIYQSVRHLYL